VTRICLDSNVLVAAFVARGLCADLLKLVLTEYQLVVPEVVAEEVRRVLSTKLNASQTALGSSAEFSVESIFWCLMVTRPA
jgi:predicted nucleic acid-binding protein